MITIYTTPSCPKCFATKRELDKNGHTYEEIQIDPEIAEELKDDGFTQAPVVHTDTDAWDGFRPDKIRAIGNYTIATSGREDANPVIIATVEHHSL